MKSERELNKELKRRKVNKDIEGTRFFFAGPFEWLYDKKNETLFNSWKMTDVKITVLIELRSRTKINVSSNEGRTRCILQIIGVFFSSFEIKWKILFFREMNQREIWWERLTMEFILFIDE